MTKWLTVALCAALPAATLSQSPRPRSPRLAPCVGLHAGLTILASMSMGLCYAARNVNDGWDDVFVTAEPGIGAGRVSLGAAVVRGNLAHGGTVRATMLRRWNNRPADYVGAEVSAHALLMGPRVGVFHKVGGRGSRMLLTVDVGFGY